MDLHCCLNDVIRDFRGGMDLCSCVNDVSRDFRGWGEFVLLFALLIFLILNVGGIKIKSIRQNKNHDGLAETKIKNKLRSK